jgi:hypothetical protein
VSVLIAEVAIVNVHVAPEPLTELIVHVAPFNLNDHPAVVTVTDSENTMVIIFALVAVALTITGAVASPPPPKPSMYVFNALTVIFLARPVVGSAINRMSVLAGVDSVVKSDTFTAISIYLYVR